jgi:nitroimidazol reductase NimA-like FMN-containing flavoprotein (pyridoxamine 5'-phosphate oxidase superfamily)
MRRGETVCVTVTLVDALVVARAAFHNSMNYRSVVVFGEPRIVSDEAEKKVAVRAVVDHVLPGRWDESRPMTDKELTATLIAALPLAEASAKIRTGPPKDEEEDYATRHWAGIIPVTMAPEGPVADPRLDGGIAAPPSVTGYARPSPAR